MQGCICVFGSGKASPDSPEYSMAKDLGRLLAQNGFIHVSGGYAGTMEAGAKAAREAGGKTIGVTVEGWGPPNPYIETVHPMPHLFARIQKLMKLGEAYIILPGATGTLIELAMAWERALKGLDDRKKPIILIGDFWLPVIQVVKSGISGATPSQNAKSLFEDYLWLAKTPEMSLDLLKKFFRFSCKNNKSN